MSKSKINWINWKYLTDEYLTDNDAWFLTNGGEKKIQWTTKPNQLIVPKSLAESAKKVLEKHAGEMLGGWTGEPEEEEKKPELTLDIIIDEQIKKLRI